MICFLKKEIPADIKDKHLMWRMESHIGFAITDMSYMGTYENAIEIIFNFIVEKEHNADTMEGEPLHLISYKPL